MSLENLTRASGEWLRGEGNDADTVISSRVRLARNLNGYAFALQASPEQKKEIAEQVLKVVKDGSVIGPCFHLDLNGASPIDRLFLVERHLISRELAGQDGERSVVLSDDESVSVMINEEDHLRMQFMRSGFHLDEVWERASRVDDRLSDQLAFAFNPRFGYLTACPTNVGTGLRLSGMLHLPALVMTKLIEKVFQALARINFTVRGLYGEGTQAQGDFYQLSNQITLGKSEEKTVEELGRVISEIVKFERTWREKLLAENRTNLEDRIWRAYGTLANARLISSEETLEQLSLVRLGVNLELLSDLDIPAVNRLFILTQPAHLQKLKGRPLDAEERDVARAEFIRDGLTTS